MSAIVPSAVTVPECEPGARLTRSLLGYGLVAGPFYVVAVLAQSLIRPGFDLTRDDASLLSNGSLGWIQVANFVLTGLMVTACAIGIRRSLSGTRRTWAAALLALYGLGLVGAGLFAADPMNGFPAGTPAGRPEAISAHGILHIVAAGTGFLGFVAGCWVMARQFATEHRSVWSRFSIATGAVFLVAFAGVASGSGSRLAVLAFWMALLIAWAWLAAVSVHLYRRVSRAAAASQA